MMFWVLIRQLFSCQLSLSGMAAVISSRLIRRLPPLSYFPHKCLVPIPLPHYSSNISKCVSEGRPPPLGDMQIDFLTSRANFRVFCSKTANSEDLQAPAAIDYRFDWFFLHSSFFFFLSCVDPSHYKLLEIHYVDCAIFYSFWLLFHDFL